MYFWSFLKDLLIQKLTDIYFPKFTIILKTFCTLNFTANFCLMRSFHHQTFVGLAVLQMFWRPKKYSPILSTRHTLVTTAFYKVHIYLFPQNYHLNSKCKFVANFKVHNFYLWLTLWRKSVCSHIWILEASRHYYSHLWFLHT